MESRGRRGADPELAKAVGQTIKVLRTDQDLDRKELAGRAGISYSYLAEIERGNKPASHSVLNLIAQQLGLQLHELLGFAEARLQGDRSAVTLREAALDHALAPPTWQAQARHPASPSARRERMPDRVTSPLEVATDEGDETPTPGRSRSPEASPYPGQSPLFDDEELLWEIRRLLPGLSPEDRRRILDLALRLSR
jgi:transcriptional regulator with XRE-family HTH domain